MPKKTAIGLGLDFGTESVRALLVRVDGTELASAVVRYRHGQMNGPAARLRQAPARPDFALQDPQDWIDSAARAVKSALRKSSAAARDVVSIGVDFTSCTILPATDDGTPLCQLAEFRREKFAWPKLWKHHGAQSQTDRINELARKTRQKWLARYGNIIGLEWFFPKIFETLEEAPHVYRAADVWLEAGDWFVWQLVGGPAAELPRSTCQAGYKAMWNARDGYPPASFFRALDPELENVVSEKLPGRLLAPGQSAGPLRAEMAARFGLSPDITVSAATIDAHAGVPGAGVAEPDTLVMVMGTSSCHMLNSRTEKLVPGVAGIVEGGILPGYFGYETGQAAVGDAFDWCRRLVGHKTFTRLNRAAAKVPAGADGVLCLDWLNGCRTPLMDGGLQATAAGLALRHGPEHLYRAVLEGSAYGLRWIVDVLQEGGVPVRRFVATGGLPHHNPLLVQICADVLGRKITVHPCQHGPALGAAILGIVAAGRSVTGFSSSRAAIRAMAKPADQTNVRTFVPNRVAKRSYEASYGRYRELANRTAGIR